MQEMGRRNIWDSMTEMVTMQEAMERMLDESWGRQRYGWRQDERVRPLPLDVYSTPEEVVIQASVPGMEPDRVEITIEGELLTIKGERKAPLENVDYHIQERGYGPFSRSLTLSVPVQADLAEAVFEQGELTLTIPKAEEVKPRTIKVKSK
jgi:HSP20 family protein